MPHTTGRNTCTYTPQLFLPKNHKIRTSHTDGRNTHLYISQFFLLSYHNSSYSFKPHCICPERRVRSTQPSLHPETNLARSSQNKQKNNYAKIIKYRDCQELFLMAMPHATGGNTCTYTPHLFLPTYHNSYALDDGYEAHYH